MKNIMIIGAGGSLGSCLSGFLKQEGHEIIAVDINENSLARLHRVYEILIENIYIENILDFSRLKRIIEFKKIDLVINCAALKHVLWCEYNIKYAINTNIIANLELINYMRERNKEFLYISSDKATNPKNIYALTKQFTDYIIKFYNFKLVRGVNFINSNGSVLDIWEEQRKEGVPFTLIDNDDCNRFFISLRQMCYLIKEAIDDASGKNEYTPEVIYKIYIKDLFKAYLQLNNIKEYKIRKVSLQDNEKVSEDLCFDADVVEIKEISDIVTLMRK